MLWVQDKEMLKIMHFLFLIQGSNRLFVPIKWVLIFFGKHNFETVFMAYWSADLTLPKSRVKGHKVR